MGWLPGEFSRPSSEDYTWLNTRTVCMVIGARPRASHSWSRNADRFLRLGRIRSQISHVPKATFASTTNSRPHTCYHVHLRSVSHQVIYVGSLLMVIKGANFFSIIMFWPTQAFNVYGHDPVGVGIRGLPVGFSILAGAFIVLWCLSVFRGRNKELMIFSSILMTAGKF